MDRMTRRNGKEIEVVGDYDRIIDAIDDLIAKVCDYKDEAEQREQECAILLDAIDTFGSEYQIDRAIEELAELTQALLKYRRAGEADLGDALKNVHEEIVDAQIVLEQLKMLFAYDKQIEQTKLARLKETIANIKES